MRFLVIGEGQEEPGAVHGWSPRCPGSHILHDGAASKKKAEITAAFAAASVSTSVVIDVEALWNNLANKVFDAIAAPARRWSSITRVGWRTPCVLAIPASFFTRAISMRPRTRCSCFGDAEHHLARASRECKAPRGDDVQRGRLG